MEDMEERERERIRAGYSSGRVRSCDAADQSEVKRTAR